MPRNGNHFPPSHSPDVHLFPSSHFLPVSVRQTFSFFLCGIFLWEREREERERERERERIIVSRERESVGRFMVTNADIAGKNVQKWCKYFLRIPLFHFRSPEREIFSLHPLTSIRLDSPVGCWPFIPRSKIFPACVCWGPAIHRVYRSIAQIVPNSIGFPAKKERECESYSPALGRRTYIRFERKGKFINVRDVPHCL